jgi:hypothetical protein
LIKFGGVVRRCEVFGRVEGLERMVDGEERDGVMIFD